MSENHDRRAFSRRVVEGDARVPSRAMLRPLGFRDEDFAKPQIGIASTWSQVTPCNMHIDQLAREAAAGADAAGGKALIFNTITISDGISMGTEGMKYSLVSREVIADSVETVVGCQGFDGLVAIGGCDKNMPGCMIAIARLNRPAVFVYGGTIQPGRLGERRIDIVSTFEAVGAHAAGRIDRDELKAIECHAIPGPGSCGGMYTANTMASAIEALGMSLPGSSAQEAVSADKREDCRRAGAAVLALLERGIRPRDILTREAFENAIAVVTALGGSTNAVLHLLAMAHAAEVPLSIDDFTRIGAKVPVLADLKPSGRYLMSELIAIGGIQPLMKTLLDAGLLHGDLFDRHRPHPGRESRRGAALPAGPGHRPPARRSDQERRPPGHPLRQPRAGRGGGQDFGQGGRALRGPRARLRFRGGRPGPHPRRQRRSGRRGRGALRGPPAAGPGMREMLSPTSAVMGPRPGARGRPDHRRPLLRRQPRLRGRPHQPGGGRGRTARPGRGRRSDRHRRAGHGASTLLVDEAVLAERRAAWTPPPPRYTRGVLAKYAKLVSSASLGAVTDKDLFLTRRHPRAAGAARGAQKLDFPGSRR
ncbi:MAG: hypothetical protein KatS3mg121_0770 [Gammaproteobacteria bacterium]|nr:MAG: hypothetical protein KatS3mg121_0770 [Gammaproteobacteria bacterium]